MYLYGGNCFCGERKCEVYPKKNKQNLLLFGGEIQNLGGEISPPKGPEKNTGSILRPGLKILHDTERNVHSIPLTVQSGILNARWAWHFFACSSTLESDSGYSYR